MRALSGGGFRASDGREGVDGLAVNRLDQLKEFRVRGGGGVFGGRGEEVLVANGGDEGDNFDVMRQAEELLSDSAGGDTACRGRVSESTRFRC